MKVRDLMPGDTYSIPGEAGLATYLGGGMHPKYPGLSIVIWRLPNDSLSFDALSPDQELYHGELVVMSHVDRINNWNKAVHHA